MKDISYDEIKQFFGLSVTAPITFIQVIILLSKSIFIDNSNFYLGVHIWFYVGHIVYDIKSFGKGLFVEIAIFISMLFRWEGVLKCFPYLRILLDIDIYVDMI